MGKSNTCNFYVNNVGRKCTYKGYGEMYVCGYTNNYIILGSFNDDLCVKAFNREQVVYNDDYNTYRFSKIENLQFVNENNK